MKQSCLIPSMNIPENESCDIYSEINQPNYFRVKSFNQHLVVFMLFCLFFSCKQTDDELISEELPTPTIIQYIEKMKLFSIPEKMAQSTNVWAQDATGASDTKENLRDNSLQIVAEYNVFMKDSSIDGKYYFKTNSHEDLSWMVCSEENTINRWEFCYKGFPPLTIIEEEKDGSSGSVKLNYLHNNFMNIIGWTFTGDNKLIIIEEYLEAGFRHQTIYSDDHSGSFETYYNGKPLRTVQWNADGSGIRYSYTDSVITETEEWSVDDL